MSLVASLTDSEGSKKQSARPRYRTSSAFALVGAIWIGCGGLPGWANGGPALTGPIAIEPPPGALRIDGDLAEWGSRGGVNAELVNLTPQHGNSHLAVIGQLRIGFDAAGLAVAGELRDDRVLFPRSAAERLTSDHLELWVAFPGVEIPQVEVVGCERGASSMPRSEDCAIWQERQRAWETFVERLFVRQYSLSTLGVAEHFASHAFMRDGFELPFGPLPDLTGATASFVTTAEGYRFEAWIPIAALPATAELPLRQLRVLIDVVDNDDAWSTQETFHSLAKQRRFGAPETFLAATLVAPVRLPSEYELAELLLALEPAATRFVLPAAVLTTVYALVLPHGDLDEGNVRLWYGDASRQTARDHPPLVVALPLTPRRTVAALGEISLAILRDGGTIVPGTDVLGGTYRLVALRGGAWLGSKPLGLWEGCPDRKAFERGESEDVCTVVTWARPPGLHVAMIDVTAANPAGRGQCGSCPVTECEIASLEPGGGIRQLTCDSAETFPSGASVLVLTGERAGATLLEAAGWLAGDSQRQRADDWIASQGLTEATLPDEFDVAFLYGEPWSTGSLERVCLEALKFDPGTGLYPKTKTCYPAGPAARP